MAGVAAFEAEIAFQVADDLVQRAGGEFAVELGIVEAFVELFAEGFGAFGIVGARGDGVFDVANGLAAGLGAALDGGWGGVGGDVAHKGDGAPDSAGISLEGLGLLGGGSGGFGGDFLDELGAGVEEQGLLEVCFVGLAGGSWVVGLGGLGGGGRDGRGWIRDIFLGRVKE